MTPQLCTRTATIHDLQIRSEGDGPTRIEGYAALWETPSQPLWELGGAREIIQRGAFTRALADGDDTRFLINHDHNLILARTPKTLVLREDEKGLFFSATLPNTSYANDLIESMKRGDITQNSFSFIPDDQAWEARDGERFSVVKAVHLRDVSIVTYPAYIESFSQLRSIAELINKHDRTDQEAAAVKAFASKLIADINTTVTQNEGVPSDVAALAAARREREIQILELQ